MPRLIDSFALTVLCISFHVTDIRAQYAIGTSLYNETLAKGTKQLIEELTLHPDITVPSQQLIFNSKFSFQEPDPEDYTIGMIIDPVCIPYYMFIFLQVCLFYDNIFNIRL